VKGNRALAAAYLDEATTVLEHQSAGSDDPSLDGNTNGTAKRTKARAGA